MSSILTTASSYEEWAEAAQLLDCMDGNEEWKVNPVSADYDHRLLASRLEQLVEARRCGNVAKVIFLLRTTLTRNLGNMGSEELYRHTYIGTKRLIEDFISEIEQSLHFVLATESAAVTDAQKLEQLTNFRQAFGRTALLLSGGGTLGMTHIGVLAILLRMQLLPRIISGSSSGSIVASVCCTRTDEELPEELERFMNGNLNVFEDSARPESIWDHLARILKTGNWMDIRYLTDVVKSLLGDITFQEAYNRTRRILNITVSSASIYELPRLLNYLTSPNVYIWSAVITSCSVPLVFSSSDLYAKDLKTGLPQRWNPSPQKWIDGSVDNDLPIAKLSELFNVNHFLVSQVNPHVVPFLQHDRWCRSSAILFRLATDEIMHSLQMLADIGVFPTACTKLRSVLAQKYSGDITILPDIYYTDYPNIISNPTKEFLVEAELRGERATWPSEFSVWNVSNNRTEHYSQSLRY